MGNKLSHWMICCTDHREAIFFVWDPIIETMGTKLKLADSGFSTSGTSVLAASCTNRNKRDTDSNVNHVQVSWWSGCCESLFYCIFQTQGWKEVFGTNYKLVILVWLMGKFLRLGWIHEYHECWILFPQMTHCASHKRIKQYYTEITATYRLVKSKGGQWRQDSTLDDPRVVCQDAPAQLLPVSLHRFLLNSTAFLEWSPPVDKDVMQQGHIPPLPRNLGSFFQKKRVGIFQVSGNHQAELSPHVRVHEDALNRWHHMKQETVATRVLTPIAWCWKLVEHLVIRTKFLLLIK